LPAAKAALVALIQTTNNAAAAISIINLITGLRLFENAFARAGIRLPGPQRSHDISPNYSTKAVARRREIGPVLA
jgi:hypothetical protein